MQAEGLRRLLAALDDDEGRAAQQYRRMHERLVRLFALNLVSDPYALADEAIDRLARRVVDETLHIQNPSAYLSGIARLLLLEEGRRQVREREVAHEWMLRRADHDEPDDEFTNALEDCLGRLKDEQQQLLRSYYHATGKQKIEQHRQLAHELGITLNALRNRLMRARRELDDCVRKKLSDVFGQGSTKL